MTAYQVSVTNNKSGAIECYRCSKVGTSAGVEFYFIHMQNCQKLNGKTAKYEPVGTNNPHNFGCYLRKLRRTDSWSISIIVTAISVEQMNKAIDQMNEDTEHGRFIVPMKEEAKPRTRHKRIK